MVASRRSWSAAWIFFFQIVILPDLECTPLELPRHDGALSVACWRRPPSAHSCVFAVGFTLGAIASMACEPIVVDAFEPLPREPAASVPLTCPPGSLKTQPGSCGCNTPDDDFDGDGAFGCQERCPDNAGNVSPTGPCGCSSSTDLAVCGELRAALRNLYTFDGLGTAIVDGQGDADGSLLHVVDNPATPLDTMQLNGRVTLDGQGSYVDLPNGLISSLGDATFEAWVVWRGGASWERIFDFGNNAGTPVDGVTYLFLTPSTPDLRAVRVAYSVAGPGAETVVDGNASLPLHAGPDDNTPDQVALVLDRTNASLRMYVNGQEIAAENESLDLGAIDDVNNWLGRSNYLVDPPLSAVLVEFRIYSQALSAAQIDGSYLAGPGALD